MNEQQWDGVWVLGHMPGKVQVQAVDLHAPAGEACSLDLQHASARRLTTSLWLLKWELSHSCCLFHENSLRQYSTSSWQLVWLVRISIWLPALTLQAKRVHL